MGDTRYPRAFEHRVITARRAEEQVFQERVRCISRWFVVRIVAHGIELDAPGEKVVYIEQITVGFRNVAHHDDDDGERRFRLERFHDRHVLAHLEGVVDDEAVFFGPGLETLVKLELFDVFLGVVAVGYKLDGDGIVAGHIFRVSEQLQSGIDYYDVVLQEC